MHADLDFSTIGWVALVIIFTATLCIGAYYAVTTNPITYVSQPVNSSTRTDNGWRYGWGFNPSTGTYGFGWGIGGFNYLP